MKNQVIFTSLSIDELKNILHEIIDLKLKELQSSKVTYQTQDVSYITKNELCKKLKISIPTLSKIVKLGHIKAYRIKNRRILFSVEEVQKFIENSALNFNNFNRKDTKK